MTGLPMTHEVWSDFTLLTTGATLASKTQIGSGIITTGPLGWVGWSMTSCEGDTSQATMMRHGAGSEA